MSYFLSSSLVKEKVKPEHGSRWYEYQSERSFSEKNIVIGEIENGGVLLACYRHTSCWMKSIVVTEMNLIPDETQFILYKKEGKYLIMIPLIQSQARASISGGSNQRIMIRIETFNSNIKIDQMTIFYTIEGDQPYRMMEIAAKEIQCFYGKSKDNRITTPFISKLGWCTYNAFYENLSESGIRAVLQEYINNKISLGYMILDAGWQEINQDNQVVSFKSDPKKFPHGLRPVIDGIKRDFSLKHVIAWQSFCGYWQGTSPQALKEHSNITFAHMEFPKRFKNKKLNLKNLATAGDEFYPGNLIGKEIGIPFPDFKEYFDLYHIELVEQGVDGIKVDAMTWVETFSSYYGGRVQAMRFLVEGLDASAKKNFCGNLLNCSSCSNDFIFQTSLGGVTRTSTDFFPEKQESHGMHLVVNAHISFFVGEFIQPDWDMFQTGHSAGEFHAVSRAISGGPIYTTDELGTMNFNILKKIVLPNGDLPLCIGYAKPTLDSLFTNLECEIKTLKIFNHNQYNSVLGIFNCSDPRAQESMRTIKYSPQDVNELKADEVIIHDYSTNEIWRIKTNDVRSCILAPLEFSLFTIALLEFGFSAIGIKGYYNIGGTIGALKIFKNRALMDLKAPGVFLGYLEKCPLRISCHDCNLSFKHDHMTGRLEINIPLDQLEGIMISW